MTEPTRRQKLRPDRVRDALGSDGPLCWTGSPDGDAAILFLPSSPVGLVFIVVTIGIAMLLLAVSPNSTPDGEKSSPGTGND
jgi:hypothetical protein